MTDLTKEFRELHAKTTQGERYITGICAGSTAVCIEGNEKAFMFLENNADAEFIVKAHKDFPKILDALEQAALNVEASQKAARAYCDELERYKKALEVCRKQRILFAAIGYDPTQPEFLKHLIEKYDQKIDQILEGEV